MPATSSLKIAFNFLKPASLSDRTRLRGFIESIFKKEGRRLEDLSFIFCSDAYLLNINRRYLKHNDLTDIITFDLSDRQSSIAEIYISVDRVRENAVLFKVSFRNELLRVIFHGVLHLCGYKDKKPEEKQVMREKEDFYLNRYFDK